MTALKSKNIDNMAEKNNLFKDYHWFYFNIYQKIQKSINEFFQKEIQLRFLGLANQENILFYGDEYFVNKIPVNKTASVMIRLSSGLVSSLLDNSLGFSENAFELKNITEIEAGLIKSFTVFAYKNIEDILVKAEASKKAVQSYKEYNLTFYVKCGNEHTGKLIITLPDYVIPKIEPVKYSDKFSIADFGKTNVFLNVGVGSAKITLNEIKAVEDGDIIVLDNSDITKMYISLDGKEVKFKINPNPSLIISIDNNGGNEMEEETSVKSQNMWDSILVDIVAEFDNVKLTLGELKQISEGLVIDVGSVYENKIKLRVENQVVATGELVILNDRYGVRIDSLTKSKEEHAKTSETAAAKENTAAAPKKAPARPSAPAKSSAPTRPSAPARPSASAKRPPVKTAEPSGDNAPKEGDENFDYSDFEIEDESI